MGVRIACAQCHNHPFDDWEQTQFYGFAAYFGKTKLVEPRVGDRDLPVFTTEGHEQMVLWPPEREKPPERFPVEPKFPFELAKYEPSKTPKHIARFNAVRKVEADAKGEKEKYVDLGDFIDDIDASAKNSRNTGPGGFDLEGSLLMDKKKVDLKRDLAKASALRNELARLITQPENRYFPRAFVNRLWKELMGRGFFEPIDIYSLTMRFPILILWSTLLTNLLVVATIYAQFYGSSLVQRLTDVGITIVTHLKKVRKKAEHRFVAAPVRHA